MSFMKGIFVLPIVLAFARSALAATRNVASCSLILLTIQLLISSAWGAPTLLRHGEWMDQVAQTSDVQTITTSAGSMLVVMVGLSNVGTNVTVSSPGLNFQEDRVTTAFDVRLEIWSAANVSAGPHTITVTCTQPEFIRWGVAEFSGVASSNYVVGANGGSGLTAAVSTGTVSVTAANTLLVAAVRTDQDDTSHGAISAGTNFTLIWPWSTGEPNQKLMSEYRVTPSGGNFSNGFTMQVPDGGGWVAGIVAYSPTGAPAAAPPAAPAAAPTPTPMVGLSFNASAGSITAPFVVNADNTISQSVETSDPASGGRAAYLFSVPNSGQYTVSMTTFAPDPGANSIFVNIDGEPISPDHIWDVPVNASFVTSPVILRGSGTAPKVWTLAQGSHTLVIRGREAGLSILHISVEPLQGAPSPPSGLQVINP
jgi:hypothetical protein